MLYPVEESRGYQARGDLWSPGIFSLTLPRRSARHARRVDRVDRDDERDAAARSCSTRSAAGAGGCSRWPGRTRSEGVAAELVLAADQFIITPAGRTEEVGAGARVRRRSAHGDRRLSLVHRLGPRHDDQPRGADAGDRPPRRGGLHPADVRALRARRPDSRTCFPKASSEGLYHTADATLWFFHAIDRYVEYVAAIALTLALLYPTLKRIIDCARARHALRHPRRRARRPAGAGRRGLSAHVDGREGRRLGRDAAARQGGRDQRALVQRAAADGAVGGRARRRSPPTYRARADRAQRSFNERFWYADGGYLYDVVDGEGGGDDAKCRPNQVFAIALPHPVLARERWEPVMRVVRDRLLTPVGLRSLAPGDPRLQAAVLRRSARARCGVSPGHGLGVAGRAVRRRVAQGLPRRHRRRRGARSTGSCRISTRRASDRSARCSTRRRRSRRAAASRRRGASPRCSVRG